MNTTASVIGLDIAKNIFVAVGRDARGKILWKKTLARDEVLPSFANLPPTLVGIEACSGSHYWARQLNGLGHDVKLIAAQHTRVYVTGNKNDANDAAAIAEARSRAATKYVSINTQAQQDLQMLHRARQALVNERKAMICRIRAFAHEYGQIFPKGVAKFRARLTPWLADTCNGLSAMALETLRDLVAQLDDKEQRLQTYDRRLAEAAQADAKAKRLLAVPGIGTITATAIVAAVADAKAFNNGRDLSANLGLIPREHSSGGKQRLYGITKRGDRYLRTLLIHGARSALRWADGKDDRILRWALKLAERRGQNVAAV
ncbi:MAG TPA: IS110 family transposase, partial [Candidatus Bathyarchaeia archaeon]|nr:IS110 family transposase [Candidatus Bathyarchaeia archaeon]